MEETKILVIDDYPSHRLLLKALLEKAGYTVILGASAQEAYEHLGFTDPSQKGNGIKLIITDLFMPGTDGLEACACIKEKPHLKGIPVLIATTASAEERIAQVVECGAVGFIRKPICESELLAHIQLVLNWKCEVENGRRIAVDLVRANKALREFTTIASHDLKGAMYKIIYLGKILQNKYSAVLGTDGNNLLVRLIRAADRMNIYFNDLLKLALSETKPVFVEADLEQIVQDIIEDLSEPTEKPNATFIIGNLPTLMADKFQMQQLFQNLITNALKFHRPGVPPQVTLGSRLVNGSFLEISVDDNGIGIKNADLSNILQPFKRLNNQNQYEGTGLGLAICNQIVKSHGGSITIKSISEVGTTFLITLPHTHVDSIGG